MLYETPFLCTKREVCVSKKVRSKLNISATLASLFLLLNTLTTCSADRDSCLKPATQHNFLKIIEQTDNLTDAFVGIGKVLKCCSVNYQKIEWFKNGNPITFHIQHGTTTFRLREYLSNETIVSDKVRKYDTGNYTCIVSNEVQQSTASIQLAVHVTGKEPKHPTWTHEPQDKYAEIGQSLALYCEAHIGFSKERRKQSQVTWAKYGMTNNSSGNWAVNYTEQYSESNGWIIGSQLHFEDIQLEDFGNYSCKISINETGSENLNKFITLRQGRDPRLLVIFEASYLVAIIVSAIFVAFFISVLFSAIWWRLELRLFFKDRYGKLEENDGKTFDVFVCYDPQDADFTRDILIRKLEKCYQYRCFVYERDAMAGDWLPEIFMSQISASRRFIMVLSPSLIGNPWCTYCLYIAIEAMLNLNSRIICIMLEGISLGDIELTSDEQLDGRTLQQILKVVKKVYWSSKQDEYRNKLWSDSSDHKKNVLLKNCSRCLHPENIKNTAKKKHDAELMFQGSEKFWKTLLLYLPPKR